MTSIKLELPANDPIALNAFSKAFSIMATEHGHVSAPSATVEVSMDSLKPQYDIKQDLPTAEINTTPVQYESFVMKGEPESTPIETEVEPTHAYYWVHAESESCGYVSTWNELTAMTTADPLVEVINKDEYDELAAKGWDCAGKAAVVTPPITVTPPATGVTLDTAGVTLDTAGLPWDKRIHARTKTVNVDGSWKLQRKPQAQPSKEAWEAYIDGVKAELIAAMGGTVVAAPVTPPPVVAAPVTPPPVVAAPTEAAVAFTAPPVVEAPVVAAPKPIVETVTAPVSSTSSTTAPVTAHTFAELMKLVTSNNTKITVPQVTEICQIHGIQALPLLASARPDMIPTIYAEVESVING
jgi:hypothetical protein